ncbi:uncharacterized protein METZ01_LOCUS336758, partial [marine metagenome]
MSFFLLLVKPLNGVWLTYEEAVLNSPFKTASLGWTIPVPNEDAYLIQGKGDDWKIWYKVSLLDMDTTVFLDSTALNWQGDDLYISKLTFSKSGTKLLLRTDSKKLWRYSHFSTYYVYDLADGRLMKVSKNNRQLRNVKFSPDGERIAYVRKDNNLYMFDFTRGRERQLTTTGSETISNGHFGWLYEEELTGYDGYRWSPNGESIAFWEEDESRVPEFTMINELGQYPTVQTIRYPKAGETNPTLKIGIIRIKGAGRKWVDQGYADNDYLPWMEWVNKDKVAYLKMDRKQKNWDLMIA